MKRMPTAQSKREFLRWFKQNEPMLYRVAEKRLKIQGHKRLGATEEKSKFSLSDFFKSAVETVKQALPTYLQAKQQKQIMDMQIKRAEQGLPPADVEAYTPAIKIQPVVTPDTEKVIERVAIKTLSSGTNKLLMFGALGLGALIFLKRKPGYRR